MAPKPIVAGVMALALTASLPALAQQKSGEDTSSSQTTPATGYGQMGYGMMGPGMMGYGMMGGGMMAMMSQYPDGYLAFLKTELAVTSAQEAAWKKFADALRDQADLMQSYRQSIHDQMSQGMMGPGMMGQGTPGPHMVGPGAQGQHMMGRTMMNTAGQGATLPDTLDQQAKWAQARADSLEALSEAAKPFYDSLSADQKAKADRLFGYGW